MCKSVSGPIFGLCSEHLSVVLRDIGFIRFQTRRNATTSTIAEANIVITRYFFVRSRQRSTTYRLKRSSSMWSQQWGTKLLERGFAYNVLLFCSSNKAQRSNNVHDVSRKDFFRLLGGLLRISTRKTNAEPRCLTSL